MNNIKDDQELFGSKSQDSSKSSRGFMRPGESSSYNKSTSHTRRDRYNRDDNADDDRDRSWRKKDYSSHNRDRDARYRRSRSKSKSKSPSKRKDKFEEKSNQQSPKRKEPSPHVVHKRTPSPIEEAKIEDKKAVDEFEGLDANQLGAKIIKAQIMGDEVRFKFKF